MSRPLESVPRQEHRGTVLLVDDEPALARAMSRQLAGREYQVECCHSAEDAVQRVKQGGVHVVVTDIAMPHVSGVQLLRMIRELDADLPVLLITGLPDLETATEAVEWGAFKYLVKPVDSGALQRAVDRAAQVYRLSEMKRSAVAAVDARGELQRAALSSSFERAIETLWVAFQPIVRASDRSIYGYEALLRSDEPSLPGPGHVVDAAERLGELEKLGRIVRARAAEPLLESDCSAQLFLNLHPRDLEDSALLDPSSALAQIAKRVVLEVTERASLNDVDNPRSKIARLREVGYRIALDDIGAGYAGLTSFALLQPEIVKLDMSLVRDIEASPVKQKLVASMASLCRDMGIAFVAEGVETPAERDTLLRLGCDLFQGYLFGRPGRPFPEPRWDCVITREPARESLPASGTHAITKPPESPAVKRAALESAPQAAHLSDQFVPLAVVDGLREGVILANAEGRLVFSNRAAERMLGMGTSEGSAADWGDYYGMFLPDGCTPFPPEMYPLTRALRGETTEGVEMLIRNANVPSGVVISIDGRPLTSPDGAVMGACVVFHDITSSRSAERQITRTNAELKLAHQRQAELSTFLVHDLKSPLTGILGSVAMLLDRPVDDTAHECAVDIRDSALSMYRMVLDLLDVHTAEDGVLAVHLQTVVISELLEQVRVAMAPRAQLRRQQLQVLSEPSRATALVDRDLVLRVLQNLVDNCIKYGPPGGRIQVDAELDAHRLLLRVRDEGPGVPGPLRDRIFEKYVQLERESVGRHRDSRGLGLRFCRVAIEAHGGRIWVEDNAPRGACFAVELPLGGRPH